MPNTIIFLNTLHGHQWIEVTTDFYNQLAEEIKMKAELVKAGVHIPSNMEIFAAMMLDSHHTSKNRR